MNPNQMSPNQVSPITMEPSQIYNNVYHPQCVPVIHPVELINQHHIVPIPQHYQTFSVKDVYCSMNERSTRSRGRRR